MRPVRFAHVGEASREESVELSRAALRSSAIQLIGSGIKSVPFPKLLDAVKNILDVVLPAKLQIQKSTVPVSATEKFGAHPENRALWSSFRRYPMTRDDAGRKNELIIPPGVQFRDSRVGNPRCI
jgi:hypothetical protein